MNSMKRVGEQMLGGEQEENPHGGSAEGRREWGMPDMEVLPGPAAEEARGGGHQRVEVPLGFADGQSIGGAVYQWRGAGSAVGQGGAGSAVAYQSGAGGVVYQSGAGGAVGQGAVGSAVGWSGAGSAVVKSGAGSAADQSGAGGAACQSGVGLEQRKWSSVPDWRSPGADTSSLGRGDGAAGSDVQLQGMEPGHAGARVKSQNFETSSQKSVSFEIAEKMHKVWTFQSGEGETPSEKTPSHVSVDLLENIPVETKTNLSGYLGGELKQIRTSVQIC